MNLRSLSYGVLPVALAAAGCTSSSPPPPPDDQPDICGEPTGDAGVPPPAPVQQAADGTGSVVFAISHLYFGDTDRGGAVSSCAWTQYGMNIDGKVTTKNSTDVCTPPPGGLKTDQTDGNGGIDNSFGKSLLPLIMTTFGSDAPSNGNDDLHAGGATTLVRLDRLGGRSDYAPLPGLVYRAAPVASPRWDGTDVREVDVASLADGSVASPLLVLDGYMADRTWVGTPRGGTLLLDNHLAPKGHDSPPLPLSHVQIAMKVDPSNASASGVLSGILSIEDAEAWAKQMGGWVGSGYCTTSSLASVDDQIHRAADILHDGTNVPGQPCDAISVGLGFDAAAVRLGNAVSLPPAPDSCADAGVDATGE